MRLARIEASDCVGCGKCLPACPFDAIIGAPQFLHTVLVEECIGCGLCVDPCPLDCIEMLETLRPETTSMKHKRAHKAKTRYQFKQERLARLQAPQLPPPSDASTRQKMQADIQAAIQRVNQKKGFSSDELQKMS